MNTRAMTEEEIAILKQDRIYMAPGLQFKPAVIADISGGGLRFISNYTYNAGDYIYCTYALNIRGKDKMYSLAGKVLSVYELKDKPGTYEHRVQYVNMDVDEREEIIKYIFEEERRQRHKSVNR